MLSHEDYTVGWVCALPLELTAATAILDEIHPRLSSPSTDANSYTLGSINGHNVVITCLPSGIYGTISAATVVSHMISTFPKIQFGLMVGIGGGAPNNRTDIRLGDIVVSKPSGRYSGVVQYDYGKALQGGQFEQTGMLNHAPHVLLTHMAHLQAEHMSKKKDVLFKTVSEVLELHKDMMDGFKSPGQDQDQLYHSTYKHVAMEDTCMKCHKRYLIHRKPRDSVEPQIHYGLIASGNQVMKDSEIRDRLAQELGILCLEMEAAGLMNQLPCLVIRGICDYSDSHKNKDWQGYAALTAAAYGKLLLSVVPVTSHDTKLGRKTELNAEEKACLQSLFITDPTDDKNALKRRKGDRAAGTCDWILETSELRQWLGLQEATHEYDPSILWLYGNPGTGKSTMSITIADELPVHSSFVSSDKTLAYFFCDSGSEDRKTVCAILRGLLYQLVKQRPELMRFILPKYEVQKERLKLSFDALWAALLDIGCDTSSGEKYCIIDALDECDYEAQNTLLTQIGQSFGNKAASVSSQGIHILITSRPYAHIGQFLGNFTCKDLSSYQKVQTDLNCFIVEKVKTLSQRKNYPKNVASKVSDILAEKAEGTFLWVGIACGELANVRSRDAIKTLQDLPRGLSSLYQNLLDKAIGNGEAESRTILEMLSFVAIAREPLSIADLAVACRLYQEEEEENRLIFTSEDIEMCNFMIIIQDGVVRLLHKSVRDFLSATRKENVIDEYKANSCLAKRCISYFISKLHALDDIAHQKQKPAFFHYALFHWPHHACIAGSTFELTEEHESFQVAYNALEKWLEIYKRKGARPEIPDGFSLLHVAARWDIPGLVRFALISKMGIIGLEESVFYEIDMEYDDVAFKAHNGVTPMEEAAKSGSITVAHLLLDKGKSRTVVTGQVLIAAAANKINGREIMQLFLSRQGAQILITEDVMKAAAGNSGDGQELMKLLLDRQRDQVMITEGIIEAAASNHEHGEKLMELLLYRKGNEIKITKDILITAARNENSGMAVMKILLSGQWNHVDITNDVLTAAAARMKDGREMVRFLLDQFGERVEIAEEVVIAVAGNRYIGTEVMELLLDNSNIHVNRTEDVIIAAAVNNGCGKKVMEVLLHRRGNQVKIKEKIFKAAASNFRFGEDLIELLLDREESQSHITEDVAIAAAGNVGSGNVIKLILDRGGGLIDVTESVAKAAANNWEKMEEIMAVVLDRWKDHTPVTDIFIEGAAKNGQNGNLITKFLLDEYGDQMEITENVIKAAANNDRCGKQVMEILLDRRGDETRSNITEDVIATTACNAGSGIGIINLFLARACSELKRLITDNTLRAVAAFGQEEILDILSGVTEHRVSNEFYSIAKLYNAAEAGEHLLVRKLLKGGVPPDTRNILGFTPLHLSALRGHTRVVKALLENTCVDVNSRCNYFGRSPICWAAATGSKEVVRLLLKAKADLLSRDNNGATPYQLAIQSGYTDTARILEQAQKFTYTG